MRRRLADESGQAMILTAVFIGMLIVCVGLVVDVGHAMLVQRQLQAGVDAAALAGVQHLPNEQQAEDVAVQYSANPGEKNAVNTVGNATTTADATCLAGVPGCNRRDGGFNGIVVRSQSRVPTWFGRIAGIRNMTVSAKATACSPCSYKPLDVMLVIDRTGSMCQISDPNNPNRIISDPSCRDLNAAKDGVRTFLKFMDPSIDKVGLALFPPVLNRDMNDSACPYTPWNGSGRPNTTQVPPWPSSNGKYYGYDQWWHPDGITNTQTGEDSSFYVVAPLEGVDPDPSDDYLVRTGPNTWDLNPNSRLVQKLGCQGGAGTTSYALSIEEAQRQLSRNGRGDVQDVIIFLSDGGANTSPTTVPATHWTNNPSSVATPCRTGIESADRAKSAGTVVYAIGYDLAKNSSGGTAEPCRQPILTPGVNYGHSGGSTLEAPCTQFSTSYCDAEDALKAIASPTNSLDPTGLRNYYYAPTPETLGLIFQQIARDVSGSRGRLIDNTNPNLFPAP